MLIYVHLLLFSYLFSCFELLDVEAVVLPPRMGQPPRRTHRRVRWEFDLRQLNKYITSFSFFLIYPFFHLIFLFNFNL
jgi:hypothetical protein